MSPREREPLDYEDDDQLHKLAGLVERLSGYRESPKLDPWIKFVMGACAILVPAAVIGGVTMFAKLSVVEANQVSTAQELSRLRDQQEKTQGRIDTLISEVRRQ